jgi:hypothetical protein
MKKYRFTLLQVVADKQIFKLLVCLKSYIIAFMEY